jgi:rhodanese-related sulfurtransferase
VTVVPHDTGLTPANAAALVAAYDLVVDCSDNFGTRYLLNDACRLAGRPLVHAGIFQFEGHVTVFDPRTPGCYRCLFPAPPDVAPNCADGGVLGVLAGTVGTLQATEVLKWVLGVGRPLVGRLLVYDALALQFQELTIPADPACPLCGSAPTITDLQAATALVARFAPQDTEDLPDDWELLPQEVAVLADFLILDVRESGADSAMANARRVPLSTLAAALATLSTERPILACCLSGEASKSAVRMLRAAGFPDSWSLRGGFLAWERAGGRQ